MSAFMTTNLWKLWSHVHKQIHVCVLVYEFRLMCVFERLYKIREKSQLKEAKEKSVNTKSTNPNSCVDHKTWNYKTFWRNVLPEEVLHTSCSSTVQCKSLDLEFLEVRNDWEWRGEEWLRMVSILENKTRSSLRRVIFIPRVFTRNK